MIGRINGNALHGYAGDDGVVHVCRFCISVPIDQSAEHDGDDRLCKDMVPLIGLQAHKVVTREISCVSCQVCRVLLDDLMERGRLQVVDRFMVLEARD